MVGVWEITVESTSPDIEISLNVERDGDVTTACRAFVDGGQVKLICDRFGFEVMGIVEFLKTTLYRLLAQEDMAEISAIRVINSDGLGDVLIHDVTGDPVTMYARRWRIGDPFDSQDRVESFVSGEVIKQEIRGGKAPG